MATLTIVVDTEVLEAARLAAGRRNASVDELVGDYLKGLAGAAEPDSEHGREPVWIPGVSREEIYEERSSPFTGWSKQRSTLEAMASFAAQHPFKVDLSSFKREDLYERD